MTLKRIIKEFIEFNKDLPDNCSAGLIDTDLFHWKSKILGPGDTPYHGGVFFLDIQIPTDYL